MSAAVVARAGLEVDPHRTGGADQAPAVAPPGAGRFAFALASREDDPEIRRLLRENALPGEVSLSFERVRSARVQHARRGGHLEYPPDLRPLTPRSVSAPRPRAACAL